MKPTRTKKVKRGSKQYNLVDLERQRLRNLRKNVTDSKRIQLIDELLEILKEDNSYGQKETRNKRR